MGVVVLHSRAEILSAYRRFAKTVTRGAAVVRHGVGYPGGSEELKLYWRSREAFWVALERLTDDPIRRYWCAYGLTNPQGHAGNVSIVVETNPPMDGFDRRCAGAFVRDERGGTYLAHSGKIGGGRADVSKSSFKKHYRGDWEHVTWPDGATTEIVVIGKVDSKRLCAQLSDFIREVARVKALVTGNGSGGPHTPGKERGVGFAPEFSGTKRQYAHTTAVESRCDHGTIVNELARQLADRGLRIGNDKCRDLFTVGRNGRVNVLFEVKTDCSTSSIYEAVGQLMFHGAGPEGPPSRVIVLPEMPKRETVAILSRIGISVVVFAIAGETVRFRKLDDALSG